MAGTDDISGGLARMHELAVAGEVAAGVLHETRNLVTGILGFAQLAVERGAETPSGDLARIEREARRCVQLLDGFLRVAVVRDDVAAVDVGAVVGDLADAVRMEAATRGLMVACEISADVARVPVRARRGVVDQVLLNLMINALDATPHGGHVVISAAARGGAVEIAVTDSGPGVPAELRARVFDAFFTTKAHGTGLGLALCRSMLAACGGGLALDAAHAPGARFVVTIPAEAA